MSTSNTAFSVLSFVGSFLVCISLPLHLKAWNIGTCLYCGWTALSLLVFCINSIIWRDNTINRVPVWCDISIRLTDRSAVGITAASLCINRGLYHITTMQTISWSKAQKRRKVTVDLAIGLGVPILSMILSYVVQSWRFSIYQEIGCYSILFNTPLAWVLASGPPVVLSLISASYAIRCIVLRRRTEDGLKKYLFTTSNFDESLWYRLLALASVEIFIVVPLSLFGIISNITLNPGNRWVSWKDTHSEISHVIEYPSTLWKASIRGRVQGELPRWTRLFYALYFFTLFGLTGEARRQYKMAWNFCIRFIGWSGPTERIPFHRFQTFTEKLTFRRSRTGHDTDASIASGRVNGDRATVDSRLDQSPLHDESAPKALAATNII